jgi:hypothetical protein
VGAQSRCRIVIGAAAALAAAGCGSTATPSLIQLRTQATRICSTASRQIGRIATPPSGAAGEVFLDRGIAVLAPEHQALQRLGAPSEAADVYRTALGALGRELSAMRDATHALDRQENPVIAFKTLQHRLAPLETQADDAWQALQIPTCASR